MVAVASRLQECGLSAKRIPVRNTTVEVHLVEDVPL